MSADQLRNRPVEIGRQVDQRQYRQGDGDGRDGVDEGQESLKVSVTFNGRGARPGRLALRPAFRIDRLHVDDRRHRQRRIQMGEQLTAA